MPAGESETIRFGWDLTVVVNPPDFTVTGNGFAVAAVAGAVTVPIATNALIRSAKRFNMKNLPHVLREERGLRSAARP